MDNRLPIFRPGEHIPDIPNVPLDDRQQRLLNCLLSVYERDPSLYVRCGTLIQAVGGYSVNNYSEDTHDSTARKELRADKIDINVYSDYFIIPSDLGYKIATLEELKDHREMLLAKAHRAEAQAYLVDIKIKEAKK